MVSLSRKILFAGLIESDPDRDRAGNLRAAAVRAKRRVAAARTSAGPGMSAVRTPWGGTWIRRRTSRGPDCRGLFTRYGVEFYLVDPRGESLAGAGVELPPALPRPPPASRQRVLAAGLGEEAWDRPEPLRPIKTFLTVTRSPLLYWVGIRIPADGPQGERGFPAVLLLRADSILTAGYSSTGARCCGWARRWRPLRCSAGGRSSTA